MNVDTKVRLGVIKDLRENTRERTFTRNPSPYTPNRLIKRMLKSISRKNGKFCIFFTLEYAVELYNQKVSDVTVVTDFFCEETKIITESLGYKYMLLSEIRDKKMKFDVIVGNPPFNIRSEDDNTATGVSGKTNLFKDFVKMLPELIKTDGTIGFITPKGIINTLQTHDKLKDFDVIDFNLMSEETYWEYDTCYFVLKESTVRTLGLSVSDRILSNMLDLSFNNNFKGININKSDKELIKECIFGPGEKVIRYLPGNRGPLPTYDTVANKKYVISAGPKVVGTHLNSVSGILATTDAICAGTTITFLTDTFNEAQSLSLFLKNNKAVKYFQKKTNVKKLMLRFEWFKKFDLNQIKTGFEYPAEWNLSTEDIKIIEEYVK
jgi:hypothetical protein